MPLQLLESLHSMQKRVNLRYCPTLHSLKRMRRLRLACACSWPGEEGEELHLRSVPQEPLREASAVTASHSFDAALQSRKEAAWVKHERTTNALAPEKRESGQGLRGLRGDGMTESRKEGVTKGRQSTDAAEQELALIRMALSQKAEDASEDADMLLAKRLQAEELQRGRPSASALPKKRTASTLDNFFVRRKL